MNVEFSLPVSLAIVLGIIAAGTAGMWGMMHPETVLTMVLPSKVVFAAIMFAIGVKHGQYRASNV